MPERIKTSSTAIRGSWNNFDKEYWLKLEKSTLKKIKDFIKSWWTANLN